VDLTHLFSAQKTSFVNNQALQHKKKKKGEEGKKMSASVDHAGFLQKAGGKFIKQNQLRYFELGGSVLFYFKTKPVNAAEVSQGSVDVTNTKILDNPAEKFCFTISGPALPKMYTLYAASDEDKKVCTHQPRPRQ